MTRTSADVVIVGGGLAGMTSAYYLAKAQVPSVVVERDAIGSHASGFAYGGLSPLSGFGIPGPHADIAQDGMSLHRELCKSLLEAAREFATEPMTDDVAILAVRRT